MLVFNTNNQVLTSIWYPLIRKWNESNYSTSWNSFNTSIKDLLNQLFSIPHLELVELWVTLGCGSSTRNYIPTKHLTNQINLWSSWKITSSTPHTDCMRKWRCWKCNLFLLSTNGTLVQPLPFFWFNRLM